MFTTALVLLSLPVQPVPAGMGLGAPLQKVERVLANEKIASDGPGLLAYLRSQTVTPEDAGRLRGWITALGADDFESREAASQKLIEAGRKAIASLKAAQKSDDREVARRATLCLESLVDGPLMPLMPNIVRLVGERQPAGAVPVLLGYLSSADDEAIEEAVFEQLRRLGVREGELDAALVSALAAPAPLVRAGAAHVAGDAKATPDLRKRLTGLLQDAQPRVRYEAAQTLLRGGDISGIETLIDLVEKGPANLAMQADELLGKIAGESAKVPDLGIGTEAERKATGAGWSAWLKTTASRAGWAPPVGLEPHFGRVLVAEFDSDTSEGRVVEIGRDGKRHWELAGLKGPNDVQPLPGGRILIAERGADRVNEYDRGGKLLWSHRTSDTPVACQRLANGDTLIVAFTEVMIITPEGKKTLSYTQRDGLRHGRVGTDGVVRVMTAQGEILELNRQGERVGKITPSSHGLGAGYWGCFVRLEANRYLAALGNTGKVVEMDGQGKIEREWTASTPVSVFRQRNGHTLISSFENRSVLEIDREGREVWKASLRGRPFYALRY